MDTFDVILSGIAVFIAGEIFVKFFLVPMHSFKQVKGEIAGILLFHANNYGLGYKAISLAYEEQVPNEDARMLEERINSIKRWNDDLSKAADDTRAIACKLIEKAEGIPFYICFVFY